MLLTSNTPLMERHEIESKVMEKGTMQTLTERNLVRTSDKMDVKVEREIKELQSGQSPGRLRISYYSSGDIASMCIKQKWAEPKGEPDKSVIMESFKTPVSIIW